MQESSSIALTYARNFMKDNEFLEQADIHIHFPEGSTPKDGPSAGITITTALLSLAMDKPIKENDGMTGEISLRGNVLPIGGLKEKSTAAHRAGIKHIIAPFQNKKDLEEIPDKVLKDVKITFVKEVEEVIKLSF